MIFRQCEHAAHGSLKTERTEASDIQICQHGEQKRWEEKKKGSTDQKNQNGFFMKMKMKSTSLSAEQKQKFFQQETYNHLFCKGWMDVACFVRGRMRKPEQSEAQSNI